MNAKPLWRDLLALSLFLSLLFGVFLGSRPLMVPDEGRYAEIPREMVESGDYLTPRLNYLKYFEKPPLFYWMEAGVIKTFGLNEWALRAVVALMSLLGCLMVYIAGLKLYDRRTGLLACIMLASCALYFSMARYVITDMPLTVWMTVSLLLFIMGTQETIAYKRRYYFWGMYGCAALAVLTKGLIGAVIPGMIIFSWLAATQQWQQLKTYYLISGTVLFLLIALPWHLLVQLKNPEFFNFYFIDQHFLRYLTNYAGRQQARWFFPAVTGGGFFPWSAFLLAFPISLVFSSQRYQFYSTLISAWQQRKNHQPSLFLLLWAVILFVFFSFSKSQLLSYALPIMPPLALLLARYFALNWHAETNKVIQIGFTVIGLLAGLLTLAIIIALLLPRPAHFHPSAWLYLAISLLLITMLASAFSYWRWGVKIGLTILVMGSSLGFIAADVAYPSVDTRSVKTLALFLTPYLQPHTEIASYHEYYQDLPVYLQRRISIVAYSGELAFGIAQQTNADWVLDENSLWQRWHKPARMFMIMAKEEYTALEKQTMPSLYPIAQTSRDILLTNHPL